MATVDFTPLFRSTIGFDHVPSLLANAALECEDDGAPPYNIEKCGDDQYRIVMAVAGFCRDDIEIAIEQNRLSVRGKKQSAKSTAYLHRGIVARPFLSTFELADHLEVTSATIGDGLLVIDLKRELPEDLKPRMIPIGAGTSVQVGQRPSSRNQTMNKVHPEAPREPGPRDPDNSHRRVHDVAQQPALHHLERLGLLGARHRRGVVDEQPRQIQQSRHPGDDGDDVQGLDPKIHAALTPPAHVA